MQPCWWKRHWNPSWHGLHMDSQQYRSLICGTTYLKWLCHRKGHLCPIDSNNRVTVTASACAGLWCIYRTCKNQTIGHKNDVGKSRLSVLTARQTNKKTSEIWRGLRPKGDFWRAFCLDCRVARWCIAASQGQQWENPPASAWQGGVAALADGGCGDGERR